MERSDQVRVPHPEFNKWFPRCVPRELRVNPSIRIFCFHGAGMDLTVWTGVGTPKAPTVNPLVSFCEKEGAQLLAVQLPGRSLRSKEPVPATIQKCVSQLLDVIAPLVSSRVPYVLVGYSMGSWIAYELACAIAKRKEINTEFRLPVRMILACMVSPDTPPNKRPWRETRYLTDPEFQEELRGWSCNEILFQSDLWAAYGKLLRADHLLLDDYIPTKREEPLGVPCSIFRARGDLKLQSPSHFVNWFSLVEGSSATREEQNVNPAQLRSDDHSGILRDQQGDSRADCTLRETDVRKNETESTGKAGPDADTALSSGLQRGYAARIGVLEGTHGLMYDPECRAKFFERILELVEQSLLDLMYDGM
uniref:3-ketoacyl-CoA reductase, putative n=1 Tax=Toxoplasma gondii (strain ATCC 50861 / VEG) TaxID=432359 RepID=A0A0F7V354_TOXGV|nr:TPA: 3-ketoacyl-CoA reductase, putative [Toxoplasma gondii VEG]